MKVGIAQIDSRVGDFAGNVRRVVAAAEIAERDGAEVVVFPELVTTGYPPRDLLYDPSFVAAARAAVDEIAGLAARLPPVVVGGVMPSGRSTPGHPGLWDAALVLRGGRVAHMTAKRLLPSYDVFHEHRWFVPGTSFEPVDIAEKRVGLLVCEDLWDEGYAICPGAELEERGAELLICISASPFRKNVLSRRVEQSRRRRAPVVYVNAAGAQDELVFDGGSFVAREGRTTRLLPRFQEIVEVVDTEATTEVAVSDDEVGETFAALVSGVRGFAAKNGLGRAFLGLSGGIDSSLVACIAREALGAERVTALAMPSRYSHPRSTECAKDLARALGIDFVFLPIEELHDTAERVLSGVMAPLVAENVQARLRALVLMAHVNRRGGMLLNTSNKTELALGYGTLYGDMAGTLSVLGDVGKPEVYALARWYDGGRGIIPEFVFDRPPSAELRPDQVDPFDYPRVSPVAEALVAGSPPPEDATREEIAAIDALVRAAEHKRWQAGIVLKVSDKSFGSGRMLPITRVFRR